MNFMRSLTTKRYFADYFGKKTFTPRRALLYVPGSSKKMLTKVPNIKVDCLVLELEDGVSMTSKAEARSNITEYLNDFPLKKHNCFELGVRINSVASGLLYDDLKELSKSKNLPNSFMIPKVDSVEDIPVIFDAFRSNFGIDRITNKDTRLVIWIESARALLDMPRILNTMLNLHSTQGFFRLEAVVFGSDDFCADIGATPSKDASEVLFARQNFVTICKAFGLQAVDSVYIHLDDEEGLRKQCEQGVRWGFTGKQTIHPKQVEVIQNAFLPSVEKLEYSRGLVAEFVENEKIGKGAFIFHGKMIDRPLLLQAINVIQMYEAIGKH